MRVINPIIYKKTYPKSQTTYWLVKCQLPAPTAENPKARKTYQAKYSSEAAAETDRMRIVREFGGGSVSRSQFLEFEMAQHRLTHAEGGARGKSVSFAVDWFIKHFRDHTCTPLLETVVDLFKQEHLPRLREKSQDEYRQYLNRLVDKFGKVPIGELTTEVLQNHVDAYPSKLHHRKCLIGLFAYCSGGSRKIRSPHKWLTENPANHVRVYEDQSDHEIVILTLEEVKNGIAMALMLDDLGYWVWCLFTGMRPEETKRFWTREEYGWNRINRTGGFIVVNSEIAKDKRRRKIIIRPVLHAWLDYFAATGEHIYPTRHRRAFREVKRAAIADEKYDVSDLLRHTNISYRVQSFDKSMATTAIESGNSEAMIRDHYLDLITDESAIEEFWSLTPQAFGLSVPPSSVAAVAEGPQQPSSAAALETPPADDSRVAVAI